MYYVLTFICGGVVTLAVLFVLAKLKLAKNEKIRKEKEKDWAQFYKKLLVY